MDGFDDLLAPSANPFADPFAKRSGSPDPWASSYQAAVSGFQDDTNVFEAERSTTPTAEESSHTNFGGEPESNANDDPLEAAALTDDTQEVEAPESHVTSSHPVTSPGFRESISHADEESESKEPLAREPSPPPISEPHPEPESTPLSPSSPSSPSVPPPTELPTPPIKAYSPPPTSTSFISGTGSPAANKQSFYNPLDQPGGLGIDRSFAGLSLGGETLGGWPGAQSASSPWGGSNAAPSEDDDDDDDKPILQAHLQAQAHAQAQAAASVRTAHTPVV